MSPPIQRPPQSTWVVSSAVEHYLDMVGVTGSIPVPPTIFCISFNISAMILQVRNGADFCFGTGLWRKRRDCECAEDHLRAQLTSAGKLSRSKTWLHPFSLSRRQHAAYGAADNNVIEVHVIAGNDSNARASWGEATSAPSRRMSLAAFSTKAPFEA